MWLLTLRPWAGALGICTPGPATLAEPKPEGRGGQVHRVGRRAGPSRAGDKGDRQSGGPIDCSGSGGLNGSWCAQPLGWRWRV